MRNKILIQYTIVTLVISIVIAGAMGLILNRLMTNYIIQKHIGIYPDFVNYEVEEHPEIAESLIASVSRDLKQKEERIFTRFLSLGSVRRVKVWNVDGTIVWSEKKQIIGQNHKANTHFQKALQGKNSFEISDPESSENQSEKDFGKIIEIYTPVKDGDEIVGVIELYEQDEELYKEVSETALVIWIVIIGGSLLLYLLLFSIFYRANKAQRRGVEELAQTQDVTIFALAYEAELRDKDTGEHLERTSLYVQTIAEELKRNPRYKHYLTNQYIGDLVKSAPLHDIGKVGVSDAILLKPGKLTIPEFEEMKKHCEYGASILRRAEEKLSFQSFLKTAIELALSHHEKWDGSGYPRGLRGESIQLSGRIMALADAYDAMTTDRVYKKAISHEECVKEVVKESGRHFDPGIVDAFLRAEKTVRGISSEWLVDSPNHRERGGRAKKEIHAPGVKL